MDNMPTTSFDVLKEWIWKTTKNQKMAFLGQCIALFCLLLWVLGWNVLKDIIARENNAPIKLLCGFYVIVYAPEIFYILYNKFWNAEIKIDWNYYQKQAPKYGKKIDGIIVDELVEFLLNEWGLPVDKVRNFRGLNNGAYKKLGDNLERMGILKRGANNARVLGTDDIDYIMEVLNSNTDSDKIIYKANDNEVYSIYKK